MLFVCHPNILRKHFYIVFEFLSGVKKAPRPRGGGGGYSWEYLVRVCRPVLQILTRFQTIKCYFPHPFSDQTSRIHTRFQTWPLGRNYVIIT